jgi:hypothetical protein
VSSPLQVGLLLLLILAINGLVWAIIIPLIRARGRRQLERHGAVPDEAPGEPAVHQGKGRYLGTFVDGRKFMAPGYFARGIGTVTLSAGLLRVKRAGAKAPVLVPREGIFKVERRSRFHGRGIVGSRITVIWWDFGGGRFETGIAFAGGEDDRLSWERHLRGDR